MFRTKDLLARNSFEVEVPPALLDILLQTFSDLRGAQSNANGEDQKLESALSTAEQIGVLEDAILHSQFFGKSELAPEEIAASMIGTLVRRMPDDVSILNKFWHAVVDKKAKEKKGDWAKFASGGKKAMSSLK